MIMDHTTRALIDEVRKTWPGFASDAAGAEGDLAVRDCAARLAADPGGEHAYLWVYGLAELAEYLTGPAGAGPEAERCAVDALVAAHRELSSRECAHGKHPYERDLEEMYDDEIWYGLPDPELLGNGLADDEEWTKAAAKELYLCPVNVAGYARITADIISPGSVPITDPDEGTGIAEILRSGLQDSIRYLDATLNDYPVGDPVGDLLGAALVPDHLTKGVRAGYLVTLHACSWYAVSGRIQDRSVLDEMTEGLETVRKTVADVPCTHRAEEHPRLDGSADRMAREGIYLRSPGGRAALQEEHADGYGPSLEAWTCPAFLRGLADETLATLAEGPGEPPG
ncbi:hypothetical protein T261_6797 [Streptomyces lydicus]|nr:hypothetical protein T261_6797 [Streptomyces lydicus]